MTDYIERQAAIEVLGVFTQADALGHTPKQIIEALPSAQLERKKGKWQITDAYPHNVYCSECHKRFAQAHWAVWEDGSLPRNFCPNCGARMEEE